MEKMRRIGVLSTTAAFGGSIGDGSGFLPERENFGERSACK
jgi:hypothetical protein